MIHVNKDYNDIPRSLLTKRTEKYITELLTSTNYKKHILRGYKNNDVKDKLLFIYNGKCAYCESIIEVSHIDQYRPKKKYYWLQYEWSNLLLACPQCNIVKRDSFPIVNENKRIITPKFDRKEWKANSISLLSEEPLLLNPEIDYPEKHLSFYPDGRMFAITERGKSTIEICKLNRKYLILERMRIIKNTIFDFTVRLNDVNKMSKIQDGQMHNILKLAFEHIFNDLIEHTKPKFEYSFFYKILLDKFPEFIIKQFEKNEEKKILKTAYDLFFIKKEKNGINNVSNINHNVLNTNHNLIQKIFKINSIEIKNIKCFKNTKIEFSDKNNVLLGINGRGKTTILQLLALALSQEMPLFENEWKNVIRNHEEIAEFTIVLTINKKKLKLSFEITEDDKIIFRGEDKELKKINEIFLVAYGTGRNAESHNFKLPNKFKNIATLFGINNLYYQNVDTANYLKQGTAFSQIKEIIKKIFNKADAIYNKVELTRFDESVNTFFFKSPTNPEYEIPLSALSAGFRTTFQWVVDFIVRAWKQNYNLNKPETIFGIVLIDEIDTHLHIKWQRTIINSLREEFKNVQFIITTHSPFIVQSTIYGNIISLSLLEDNVIANKVEIELGSSYESIIKELFDEKATFSKEIEDDFDEFYNYLREIRKNNKSEKDIEFKEIISKLNKKGEEVSSIISLELRQLKFEQKNKKK